MRRVAWGRRLRVAVGMALLCAGVVQAQTKTSYVYDSLGRVVAAIDDNGPTVTYDYDKAGNRIRLSNGAAFQQYTAAFFASSTQGTTGLQTAGTMQDGGYSAASTIHITATEAQPWIEADLGAVKSVNHIKIAAADNASLSVGPANTNGALVEYSLNHTVWTSAASVSGLVADAPKIVALGGIQARYIRLRRASTGQLALGDFMLFSAASETTGALMAQNDSATATEGGSVAISPLINDYAPGGATPTISSFTQGAHGAVTKSSQVLTYTPAAGYFGPDSFNYSISDGSGATATAAISVMVTSLTNQAPVATNDTIATSVGTALTFDPRTNDSDPNSDPITVTSASTPSHGLVAVNGGGASLIYTPTSGYSGVDSFTYAISDGRGGTASATVNVTIAAAGRIFSISPAVGGKSTWNLDGDGPLLLSTATVWTIVPQTTFTTDVKTWGGGGGTGTCCAPNGAAGGFAGGTVTFTANATYQLYVGGGGTSTAAGVNGGGAPAGGTYHGGGGGGYSGVRAASGAAMLIAGGGGGGGHGGVGGAGGGASGQVGGVWSSFSGGAAGTSSVGPTFQGGAGIVYGGGGGGGYHGGGGGYGDSGGGSGGGGGSGYVDSNSVSSGLLTAGSGSTPGASGDPDRGSAGAPLANGRLVLAGGFRPNTPPIATADTAITDYNTALTFNPRSNDTDADGDSLTISSVGTPAHGAVVINSGATVTYTPTSGYSGSDSFTYSVSDGWGGTASGTVSITVSPQPNYPPAAANDTVSALKDVTLSFDPRTNDSDANGDPLVVSAISAPGHGSATIGAGGTSISYTPTAGYTGADSLDYTITDGRGGVASASVSVTVSALPTGFYQPTVRIKESGLNGASIGSPTFDIPAASNMSALMSQPPSASFNYEINVVAIGSNSGFIGVASQAWYDAGANYSTSTAGTAHWYIGASSSYGEQSGASASWVASGQSLAAGDVLGVAYSAPQRKLRVYRNGSLIGTITPASSLAGTQLYPMLGSWVGRLAGSYRATPSSYYASYTNEGTNNTNPVATNDNLMAQPGVATVLSPLVNDIDAEGDALLISSVGSPSHGTVTTNPGATALTYTATAGYTGPDNFAYTISDGRGGASSATINMTVSPYGYVLHNTAGTFSGSIPAGVTLVRVTVLGGGGEGGDGSNWNQPNEHAPSGGASSFTTGGVSVQATGGQGGVHGVYGAWDSFPTDLGVYAQGGASAGGAGSGGDVNYTGGAGGDGQGGKNGGAPSGLLAAGGGGAASSGAAGPAGSFTYSGAGGPGAVAAGGASVPGGAPTAYGGGGGGGTGLVGGTDNQATAYSGGGGGGGASRKVYSVTPGQAYSGVVGAGGAGAGTGGDGSRGVVLIEWGY